MSRTFAQRLEEAANPQQFWDSLSGKAQRHWLQIHPQSQYHDTARFKLKSETDSGQDFETAAGLGRSDDEVLSNVKSRLGLKDKSAAPAVPATEKEGGEEKKKPSGRGIPKKSDIEKVKAAGQALRDGSIKKPEKKGKSDNDKEKSTEKDDVHTSKSGKSKGAVEVKGETAQDVLEKDKGATDFSGPKDKESSLSGNVEAERKIVSEINKIADWAGKVFKAEKKLVEKYQAEGYIKTKAKEKAAQEMKADKEKYSIDLCTVSVPGTNLFCGDNKGIPRKEMPQLKGNAVAGSDASKLEADDEGSVSAEEEFKKHLQRSGHTMLHKKVDAASLKATQSQLVGTKVAGMYNALKADPKHEKIGAPIFISKDGYILDGHHRWAAHVALDMADGLDVPVTMDVIEVDMGIDELVDATNAFANSFGIAQKSGDVAKKEEPKKAVNEMRFADYALIGEAKDEDESKKEDELRRCPKSPAAGKKVMGLDVYPAHVWVKGDGGKFKCKNCDIPQSEFNDEIKKLRGAYRKRMADAENARQKERALKREACLKAGGHKMESVSTPYQERRGDHREVCTVCGHYSSYDSGD